MLFFDVTVCFNYNTLDYFFIYYIGIYYIQYIQLNYIVLYMHTSILFASFGTSSMSNFVRLAIP